MIVQRVGYSISRFISPSQGAESKYFFYVRKTAFLKIFVWFTYNHLQNSVAFISGPDQNIAAPLNLLKLYQNNNKKGHPKSRRILKSHDRFKRYLHFCCIWHILPSGGVRSGRVCYQQPGLPCLFMKYLSMSM